MNKITLGFFIFTALVSCQSESSQKGCVSEKLSPQQKKENNLFLSFYYGMTLLEFKNEEQKLINAGSLLRADTVSEFLIVTNYGGQAKSVFILTPEFEECSLYSITLQYAGPNTSASFESYGLSGTQDVRNIPEVYNVQDVERLYIEKYGKPKVDERKSVNGYRNMIWKIGNKEIKTCKFFSESRDMNKKPYRQFSDFKIEYKSVEFGKKIGAIQDSVEALQKKKIQQQVEEGKKAI